MAEKDVTTELVHERAAPEAPDRPTDVRAGELSDSCEDDDEDDLEPPGRSKKAGIAEGDLRRNGNTSRFGEGEHDEREVAPGRKEVLHDLTSPVRPEHSKGAPAAGDSVNLLARCRRFEPRLPTASRLPCTISEAQVVRRSSSTRPACTAGSSSRLPASSGTISVALHPISRGHGESGVPDDLNFDWTGFAVDVLTAVEALGLERPIGIGHSCGGAALLLAEQAQPGTFAALYCFEPVVLSEDPSEEVSERMARAARQRREVFSSRREAYDNYASKPPFNAFDGAALSAYVEFGFEDLPDGKVRLRCRGEVEALVYEASYTHSAFSRLGEVKCPTLVACGSQSDHFTPDAMASIAERLVEGRLEILPELGHFGPLERPEVVAGCGDPSS